MNIHDIDMNGLSNEKALELQNIYGKNELEKKKKENFIIKMVHTICEPMFLLLIIASVIYFLLGQPKDGMVMLVFVCGMITIDVIQEWKTDKTLNALKELSEPMIDVIRDGIKQKINSIDLVPGDLMIIYEGVKVPADGFVIKCSGLKIDESSLTGESEQVRKRLFDDNNKEEYFRSDYCYAGTLVTGGTGTIYVDKIGSSTEYGNIGKSLNDIEEAKTPLEVQTDKLVKVCAFIAFILFLVVAFATYLNIPDHAFKPRIIESILSGITLAMAMIPEEFPVILTVFLSMGAWRLAKKHSLVKKLSSVETLGSVSVLCVDKTGTITQNRMKITEEYTNDKIKLSTSLVMACQEDTFDPMEKAMIKYASFNGVNKDTIFENKIVREYAFTDEQKMMAHARIINNKLILSCKGSLESVIDICDLTDKEKDSIIQVSNNMSHNGLRVIAVARNEYEDEAELPLLLSDSKLEFIGLVGLIDPPKDNVKEDIKLCYKAGIKLAMITGDNGITASSIAKSIGMKNCNNIITGKEIDNMSDEELRVKVKDVTIFSRVTPNHKLRIVSAFQENGEVVAMTGDGVNDAPALKKADIGIAMGKRGSEVSKEAANLILLDDNFTTIVDTIKDGRRIYDNIKKAMGYIFTIHIPIAFSSLLAPMLGIRPSALLLLPIHVVLLELIIDPTCSVVLERQPAESNIMQRNPRNKNEKILTFNNLFLSIIQGILIFISSFVTYYCVLKTNGALTARCMGLLIIIISNILLVQVNSSRIDYAFQSFKKLIKDKIMWLANIIIILGIIVAVYSPLNNFLKLKSLSINQLLISVLVSFISVFWVELIKLFKKISRD